MIQNTGQRPQRQVYLYYEFGDYHANAIRARAPFNREGAGGNGHDREDLSRNGSEFGNRQGNRSRTREIRGACRHDGKGPKARGGSQRGGHSAQREPEGRIAAGGSDGRRWHPVFGKPVFKPA